MKVLYVGRDREDPSEYCPGSVVCMSLVEKIEFEEIEVQDCNILRRTQNLPSWLNGTPILIDREDGTPYRGRAAVQHLREILKHQDMRKRAAPPPSVPAARSKRHTSAPPPRMEAPAMSRTGVDQGNERLGDDFGSDDDDNSGNFQNDEFAVQSNAPIGNEKVTENDLQRYMEQRNSSPAAQSMQQNHPPM